MRTLAFRAAHVAGDTEPPLLTFEDDGEPRRSFALMRESGGPEARIWWSDLDDEDGVVVALADVRLEVDRFACSLVGPGPNMAGPGTVEITFEPLHEATLRAVRGALEAILLPPTSRFRTGPAIVGLGARGSAWQAVVGASVALEIDVTNAGGPLSGLKLELEGSVIAEGILQVEALTLGTSGPVDATRRGGLVRGLALLHLPAAIETEGQIASSPRDTLRISVRALRPGDGLLTLRAVPRGASGRTGAAVLSRPIVVRAT